MNGRIETENERTATQWHPETWCLHTETYTSSAGNNCTGALMRLNWVEVTSFFLHSFVDDVQRAFSFIASSLIHSNHECWMQPIWMCSHMGGLEIEIVHEARWGRWERNHQRNLHFNFVFAFHGFSVGGLRVECALMVVRAMDPIYTFCEVDWAMIGIGDSTAGGGSGTFEWKRFIVATGRQADHEHQFE